MYSLKGYRSVCIASKDIDLYVEQNVALIPVIDSCHYFSIMANWGKKPCSNSNPAPLASGLQPY